MIIERRQHVRTSPAIPAPEFTMTQPTQSPAPIPEPTRELEIDLALIKRDTARKYARKRHVLRAAVDLGLVSREQAREAGYKLTELMTTWRAARALLKEFRRV